MALRRHRRITGLLLLGALLFAQAAQALEACLQAPVAAAKVVAAESMEDCHGMSSKAGCLAQLTAPDRSSAHAAVSVFESLAATAPKIRDAKPRVLATLHCESVTPAAEPPPIIRFCSFLL
ncbi:MAG TPA: hypothetical protein VNM24_15800 [Burkholderiales bacterium]|jgi:hypothetical protein|nr:hypothetical protein [Burkholderiales bacterium]